MYLISILEKCTILNSAILLGRFTIAFFSKILINILISDRRTLYCTLPIQLNSSLTAWIELIENATKDRNGISLIYIDFLLWVLWNTSVKIVNADVKCGNPYFVPKLEDHERFTFHPFFFLSLRSFFFYVLFFQIHYVSLYYLGKKNTKTRKKRENQYKNIWNILHYNFFLSG